MTSEKCVQTIVWQISPLNELPYRLVLLSSLELIPTRVNLSDSWHYFFQYRCPCNPILASEILPSFCANFIVDPDQVRRMTMLILWKIMMLRKKIMLLMTVLMMRLITFEQVARAMYGRDLPATTWSGRWGTPQPVQYRIANIPNISEQTSTTRFWVGFVELFNFLPHFGVAVNFDPP